MNKKYFQRLSDTKFNIIYKYPFFAEILLSLRLALAKCTTAYTDSHNIVFDPCFIDILSDLELEIVLFHELLHCVFQHVPRSKGRVAYIYNLAADIIVNSFIYDEYNIEEINHISLMHKYKGKEGMSYTCDELYEYLLEDVPDENFCLLDNHEVWQYIEEDFKYNQEIETKIKRGLRLYDSYSSSLRKVLKDKCMKSIPWEKLLFNYLNAVLKEEDYSFSKKDNRFDDNVFVPDLVMEEDMCLNHVYIAVDCSGSISDKEYNCFRNEIKRLTEILDFKGYISFFNHTITEPQEISHYHFPDFDIHGYGGTSFHVIFEQVRKLNDKLDVIIILTDGESEFPVYFDSIPVIWVLTKDKSIPFGKKVIMNYN